MFKNKKFLCVAAILVAATIGLTVYAAFANPAVASKIMSIGLTNVGWSASFAPDEPIAAGETTASPTAKKSTCPLEDVDCSNGETCKSEVDCDTNRNQNATSTSSVEPFLGVKVSPIHESLYLHVPELSGQKQGVMVDEVINDSPAMEAGLERFDLVTHYNEKAIESPRALAELVKSSAIDEEIELTYLRNGEPAKVNVVLKSVDRITRVSVANSWMIPRGKFGLRLNWPWLSWPNDDLTSAFDVNVDTRTPKSWSESQSIKMTRDQDGNYDVKIEYHKNGDRVERTFSGTREEVLTAIDEDTELSDTVKQRLQSRLSEETIQPSKLANEAFKKMKNRIDESFLDQDLFSHDVFDRWFDDDWLNDDWFGQPNLMQSDVYTESGGAAGNSGQEEQSQKR